MKIITLESEEVKITFDEKTNENYMISIEGAIAQCIKHIYRYNEFHMPKDIMATILFKALKGCGCKEDHFDISQRLSLYEYLKDKNIDDPYIKQFIKETEERQGFIKEINWGI